MPLEMSLLIWVHAIDCVMHLKNLISNHFEYLAGLQYLIFGAQSSEESQTSHIIQYFTCVYYNTQSKAERCRSRL